jgi:hypothetical protein
MSTENKNLAAGWKCITGNEANGWWNHYRAESGPLKDMGFDSVQF